MPQGAGELLDLQLRVGDGGLDGDDVLHVLRLGQQGLQPLQLGLLGHQAALRVVVRLADVLAALLLVGHMANRPHLVQEGLELVRGDAHRVVAGAVAAAVVVDRRLLKVAPQDLHQRPQVRVGGVEARGLHLHPGGVDHLGVLQPVIPAVLTGGLPGLFRHRRLRPGAVGAAGIICAICSDAAGSGVAGRRVVPAATAAGQQPQQQEQRQHPCKASLHSNTLLFMAPLPNQGLYPDRRKSPSGAASK